MSQYTHEVVMICTAADRDLANRLACAMQHDELPGKTFAIPIPAGGKPTHYGCCAYVVEDFAAMLQGVADGVLPEAVWQEAKLTPKDVAALMSRMTVAVAEAGAPRALWEATLAQQAGKAKDMEAVPGAIGTFLKRPGLNLKVSDAVQVSPVR